MKADSNSSASHQNKNSTEKKLFFGHPKNLLLELLDLIPYFSKVTMLSFEYLKPWGIGSQCVLSGLFFRPYSSRE